MNKTLCLVNYVLFLDDERLPPTTFDIVMIARSVESAKHIIEQFGCPEFISFDHDLGTYNDGLLRKTGHDFAKLLVEMDFNSGGTFIPDTFKWNVHSANPVGLENINGTLNGYLSRKRSGQFEYPNKPLFRKAA